MASENRDYNISLTFTQEVGQVSCLLANADSLPLGGSAMIVDWQLQNHGDVLTTCSLVESAVKQKVQVLIVTEESSGLEAIDLASRLSGKGKNIGIVTREGSFYEDDITTFIGNTIGLGKEGRRNGVEREE